MLTFEQAKQIFLKEYPRWTIESPMIYKHLYVFVAYDKKKMDMPTDCMFAVDSKTGELYSFAPFENLDDFNKNARPISTR